ncbi:MAG: PilZ domain-containing protein [Acidobacteriota bacterium]|nr:PilZ domain-containing protein [Blastocatellia bacterium]MDW8411792.1 PilZ domain-containing protein [Acidobacteriota bacterium]
MERRVRPRLKVTMPVQVIGKSSQKEKFRELCQTQDASAYGLRFQLVSPVDRGSVLYLSMRMPRKLRLYDLAADIYHIYAQVQHVKLLANGLREVGVAFLGKTPPPGYEALQSSEYLTLPLKKAPGLTGEQRVLVDSSFGNRASGSFPSKQQTNSSTSTPSSVRVTASNQAAPSTQQGEREYVDRETRFPIPIEVSIEFLDTSGTSVFEIAGLVSNISRGGACIMSTQDAAVGSILRLNMPRENFIVKAEVRSVSNPQPGLWNLHVKFIDKQWMGGG